jgi:hypothetical protein
VRSPLSSGVRRTRPVGPSGAWRGAAARERAAAAHHGSGTAVARVGLLAPMGKRAGRRGGTAARPAHLGPTPRRWAVGVKVALGRRRRRLDRPAGGCGESVLGLEADIRSPPNAPQVRAPPGTEIAYYGQFYDSKEELDRAGHQTSQYVIGRGKARAWTMLVDGAMIMLYEHSCFADRGRQSDVLYSTCSASSSAAVRLHA